MKHTLKILAIVLALASCASEPKVDCKVWYNWPERNLPDFSTLGNPDLEVVKKNIDLIGFDEDRDHYCILFETTLNVENEEEYTFILTTDDGSRLYIDGEQIIENDGAHGPIEKRASRVLGKGQHQLKIEYFDFDKWQSLVFRYSSPTIKERELNDKVLMSDDKKTNNHKFVKPQVKETFARYKEWKGDDVTVVFPILTDIHTAGRFTYKHIGYAAKAAKVFEADFMVNLGDFGLNAYPATVDKNYAAFVLDNTRKQMEKYDGIWLYTPGNHDWDGGEGEFLTESFLQEFFQKPWQKKAGGNLHLVPGKVLCWYDIPAKNTRIILLNSCGTGTQDKYYYFDDPQLEWFQGILDSTPRGMNVVVMSHYMPHPQGRWTIFPPADYTLVQNEKLMNILSKYKADGGTLVGFISGDTHTNDHIEEDGVDYLISQGYGWIQPSYMLPGSKHAFFDYKQTLCVDVVAIKPEKHEVKSFRIGAGGKEYDLEFTY